MFQAPQDGAARMPPGGYGGGGGGGYNNYGGNFESSMYGAGGGYGMPSGMNSMYGGGSMYGGMGSLAGGFDEQVVVTKIFSSRRDLDRLASGNDFPRRFDSNWGSFHSASGAPDAYGGSMYGAAGGSMLNFGDRAAAGSMNGGFGATGADADGSTTNLSSEGKKRDRDEDSDKQRNGGSDAATASSGADGKSQKSASSAKRSVEDEDAARRRQQEETERMANELMGSNSGSGKKSSDDKAAEAAKASQAAKAAGDAAKATEAAKAARAAEERAAKDAEAAKAAEEKAAKDAEAAKAAEEKATKAAKAAEEAAKKAPSSPAKGGQQGKREADDIPLLREEAQSRKGTSTPPRELASKPSIGPAFNAEERNKAKNGTPGTKGRTPGDRHARAASRRASRPQSRLTSMNVVDFPEAEEVKDDMAKDNLVDPEQEIKEEAQRAERQKEREAARNQAREERERQRQIVEDAQKKREEEARKRREDKGEEERRKKEQVAKMDDERRRQRDAAASERERKREEEKRKFEENKRLEDEREAARTKALLEERRKAAEAGNDAAGDKPRSSSRPRSRRPTSRPNSNLRGAIPEQPPDVVAGQIKDTLAGDLGKPLHNHTEDGVSPSGSNQPSSNAMKAASPSSNHTEKPDKEKNMVKTFVLVEEIGRSNHAIQTTNDSITYQGQTVNVTEVKRRAEDNFNYNSSVVHDVRQAVCSGFNAAVLSLEAPNTAAKFDSPVWSILNRIVRSVLQENSDKNGKLNENFELTCAMGYLYQDKVKDLLSSEDAPFAKVAVNPSPIYGPRLTNLTYGAVSSAAGFEEVLTSTLSRSAENAVLGSMTEGATAAFVLVKQMRVVDGHADIFLSSLVVASAAADVTPYDSAVTHAHNDYATIFHLVLGGPSCTCFMLNIADDDSIRKSGTDDNGSVSEKIKGLLELLQKMSSLENYALRSGSVKRFIKYVEKSHKSAADRLEKEQDENQKRRVERYIKEQERLLEDAYRMLNDAHINFRDEL